MRKRTIIGSAAATILATGLSLGLASSASAGHTPTPTPVTPTVTATPTPTVNPAVSPFAGCQFTTTQAFTFDPNRGRFVTRLVPAIVCDGPGRQVRVYDLLSVSNGSRW